MSHRNLFLVAYDIRDPKRWRKVFKTMHGYGEPLQYSVFSCALDAREKAQLIADLHDLLHHEEDRVMIADLGPRDGRARTALTFLGRSDRPQEPGPVIL